MAKVSLPMPIARTSAGFKAAVGAGLLNHPKKESSVRSGCRDPQVPPSYLYWAIRDTDEMAPEPGLAPEQHV